MTSNREDIRRAVVEHYGARARWAASDQDSLPVLGAADESCCAPASPTEAELTYVKGLYARDQVEGLPVEAIEAAAGCGNPTAIAGISRREVVLDLGSGGGIDCFLAARRTGPEGRVIGVDMTVDMIDLARRNAAKMGINNVEFRLGDIEALPVEDQSVDLVISNCVVNLSTDKQATLNEAFRVLRPGGRLRISDMVWREQRPPEGAQSLDEWAECIAGAVTLPQFLAGLEAAGFVNARADAVRDLRDYKGLASALISAEKP